MGDISKNFNRSEFACKCGCGQDTVDAELITILQRLRDNWDYPVTINSGNRCVEYNEKIQKEADPNYVPYSSKSQHLLGRAADIVVENKTPHQVYRKLEDWYPYQYGMGSYDTFTHIDSRGKRSRWKG